MYMNHYNVIWNQTELGLVSKQSEKCDYNPNLDVLIVLCGDCKYIINESKILPLNAPRFNYLIQLLQNTTVKIIKRRYRIELVYVHVNRPHKPTCPWVKCPQIILNEIKIIYWVTRDYQAPFTKPWWTQNWMKTFWYHLAVEDSPDWSMINWPQDITFKVITIW